MGVVLFQHDRPDPAAMGGKAAALAELASHDLPVPPWFVVTPAAMRRDGESIAIAGESAAEIDRAIATLAADEALLAVRSSAVDEDGSAHSFAGQLESYLFVPADRVKEKIVEVWRSGFSPRVEHYRREHGLAAGAVAPAVLVQQMIDADVAGVAFFGDPVTGDRQTILVSAVFGLGTALVGGDADADTFHLDAAGRVLREAIARKRLRHVADPESATGTKAEDLSEADADRPTLSAPQLARIAELVARVSRLRGRPQDIEWALRGDRLYLLQSRPITSLANLPDPAGIRVLWDNSNIAESYAGITTPLTFSFARRAYEGAYRQLCRLMKVSAAAVRDNDAMFGQMLGLIRGRVYYNLVNWYRLLAMLPGYSVNRQFMEQMMGVREPLPADVVPQVAARSGWQRQGDRLRLAWSIAGLAANHLTLRRKIAAFYRRLNDALAEPAESLSSKRLDELVADFRRLESRLVTRWDAPLINDFLAMIFFGVLGKLCAKWCPSAGVNLHNDLISGEGGIISAEPARRIAQMAELAAGDDRLVSALCEDDAAKADAMLAAHPALATAYRAYLEKFGDRCLEELKLESPTLVDHPLPLLRSIGQTARRSPLGGPPRPAASPRDTAERAAGDALRGRPLRRGIFRWVLRNARGRVRDRENLRFERTRLFGRVRRIFVEVGRRLFAEGRLDDPRDVFYLSLDEILSFAEGTSVSESIREMARLRHVEFDRFRQLPAPAARFETRGAVYIGNQFQTTASIATGAAEPAKPRMYMRGSDASPGESTAAADASDRTGIGCCPGMVRGAVRIIRDPREANLRSGEILVAERTDPGWIMIFPAAAGILVERGSVLSHSAIVAREMGIPAIVAIPGLLDWLADGQHVEMDGATGRVRKTE